MRTAWLRRRQGSTTWPPAPLSSICATIIPMVCASALTEGFHIQSHDSLFLHTQAFTSIHDGTKTQPAVYTCCRYILDSTVNIIFRLQRALIGRFQVEVVLRPDCL